MSGSRRSRLAASIIFVALALLLAMPPVQGAAPAAGAPAQRTIPGVPPGIDAAVARIMESFEVPGLSLAIVKDGRVVLAKGYGVRKLGDPAPVDARTLFGIASNTKVFT
ncbi:MAG: serine hydrolase, partial [Candidatus Aminicenantales bacterium]